jgi:flavin reductase (DIM6/NTAB) family NADH-FMN oxidoreductase RutF
MHYETDKNNHGLPFNPFKSCVVPRPIAWISTLGRNGSANLAPFSQFNIVGWDPPYIMFAASAHPVGAERKDSVRNVQETGEFVFNMATYDLRHAVNKTGLYVDSNVDEFELANLEKAPSLYVKPPRVAAAPVHFECTHQSTIVLPGNSPETLFHVVIGKVIAIHIKDEFITKDGKVDIARIRPLARLGYLDYTSVESIFTMPVETYGLADAFKRGMGGEAKGRVAAAG